MEGDRGIPGQSRLGCSLGSSELRLKSFPSRFNSARISVNLSDICLAYPSSDLHRRSAVNLLGDAVLCRDGYIRFHSTPSVFYGGSENEDVFIIGGFCTFYFTWHLDFQQSSLEFNNLQLYFYHSCTRILYLSRIIEFELNKERIVDGHCTVIVKLLCYIIFNRKESMHLNFNPY
jgi:hypothetical protein